ncbi:ABC transporter ATP-binding protein [Candidatus Kirkpatrickella diaphorinae]|uniref:ABC transporter ATP-binding protein n=1 Tax=Candidatus Kirkpatrickella diaphorinae TaxID=2984322 RepID=A0ABY6GIQ8_9PROT|nr:ABC transporter ATP-binding protein [Candidatus Kirkpatrickella diaphorinae]UYH50725.1 ABC transporter ATP-binding protein [Candidatus Kirkpatrickella diaphorinae]
MTSLLVEKLSLSFPIYHADSRNLRRWLGARVQDAKRNATGGVLEEDERHRLSVQVLRDISFSVRSGERLGLVGRNGAGKTTLMRALAGIYAPLSGRITIEGRFSALLDAQLGMNPELTGAENIHLRCLFSGCSRKAYRSVLEDVANFAELGSFIDLPVKTYSSGMALRLAFGLASAITPQILLMDEWMMAGDARFMERARLRLERLVDSSEIMVLSSHVEDVLRQWCTRIIWLEGGEIRQDGPPDAVLNAYAASI